jgi:hypothetical protein
MNSIALDGLLKTCKKKNTYVSNTSSSGTRQEVHLQEFPVRIIKTNSSLSK